MSELSPSQRPGSLQITREEALSSHVDDLLKRQASLRGQGGITRDRKGKWYYQNWFIFLVVGMVSAAAAWAVIEPFFDDMPYLQGPIQAFSATDPMPTEIPIDKETVFRLNIHGKGWIQINGQKVWMSDTARFLKADGGKEPLDFSRLSVGHEAGVYVLPNETGIDLEVAAFVVADPSQPPPHKATMTLQALKAQIQAAGLLLFAVTASLIGLGIGAADGVVCRIPRRAILGGGVGLLVGFLGGFFSTQLANMVYAPLSHLALKQAGDSVAGLSTFGFLIQMGGRALAWCLAGMAMGLGQGIALRSPRLLAYGFLGGVIGGLLGGLLFDPIDLLLLGPDKPSAHWSRLVGMVLIGAGVGGMIGVIELLARDAWLRMIEGPLAGKEFLLFKDVMHLGSSPRSEIYLFNDEEVAPLHATIRTVGDNYEIENTSPGAPTVVNGRPAERARLRHGDQIGIGRTTFVFQKRKG